MTRPLPRRSAVETLLLWIMVGVVCGLVASSMAGCRTAEAIAEAPDGALAWLWRIVVAIGQDVASILLPL